MGGNGYLLVGYLTWLYAMPEAAVSGGKYNLQLDFSIAPTKGAKLWVYPKSHNHLKAARGCGAF